jgi:hypothetical protein
MYLYNHGTNLTKRTTINAFICRHDVNVTPNRPLKRSKVFLKK